MSGKGINRRRCSVLRHSKDCNVCYCPVLATLVGSSPKSVASVTSLALILSSFLFPATVACEHTQSTTSAFTHTKGPSPELSTHTQTQIPRTTSSLSSVSQPLDTILGGRRERKKNLPIRSGIHIFNLPEPIFGGHTLNRQRSQQPTTRPKPSPRRTGSERHDETHARREEKKM